MGEWLRMAAKSLWEFCLKHRAREAVLVIGVTIWERLLGTLAFD
jgi:hypothetical protein